jgi:precorrin-3B synthase
MSVAEPSAQARQAGSGNPATTAGGRPALDQGLDGGNAGSRHDRTRFGQSCLEGSCVDRGNKHGGKKPGRDDERATHRGGARSVVEGWCPGALRPMPSGDGLIVRLRLSGGDLGVALAERIAQWSRLWGNGQIDLTSRANLQLRGLSLRHLPDLHEALAEFGLLDGSEAGEAVRNVTSSPLTGLDPSAVLDVRPITESLERRLADDASLHALPGKFGFAVDDGGLLGLDGVAADIQFVACHTSHGPAFTIRLAGAGLAALGPCRPDAVADVAATLGRIFLRLRWTAIRRMRDLVAAVGAAVIAREARLAHDCGPSSATPPASAFLGAHALGAAGFLGVGLPFGRISAKQLGELASTATAVGGRELRLTPWRTILVPVPSVGAAHALSAGLAPHSFILDPGDVRRRVAACPGAPACGRATTTVRDHAASLVALAGAVNGPDVAVHVSGCEKGCAHPGVSPVTLVGRNGRYDLVRDGNASGRPAMRDLTFQQAAAHLRRGSA